MNYQARAHRGVTIIDYHEELEQVQSQRAERAGRWEPGRIRGGRRDGRKRDSHSGKNL